MDALTYAGNMETLAPVMDNPYFKFVKADIADREAIYDIFEQEKPDVIVNFAAESHVAVSYTHLDVYKRQVEEMHQYDSSSRYELEREITAENLTEHNPLRIPVERYAARNGISLDEAMHILRETRYDENAVG